MIGAVCEKGKNTLMRTAPFSPHADGLLWTSRHRQGLEGSLFGDKALSRICPFKKGIAWVSLWVSLFVRWPTEENEKVRIQHPISMSAKTMTYLVHSKNKFYFKMSQGIVFGSSLYRFPWFWATWNTKERSNVLK